MSQTLPQSNNQIEDRSWINPRPSGGENNRHYFQRLEKGWKLFQQIQDEEKLPKLLASILASDLGRNPEIITARLKKPTPWWCWPQAWHDLMEMIWIICLCLIMAATVVISLQLSAKFNLVSQLFEVLATGLMAVISFIVFSWFSLRLGAKVEKLNSERERDLLTIFSFIQFFQQVAEKLGVEIEDLMAIEKDSLSRAIDQRLKKLAEIAVTDQKKATEKTKEDLVSDYHSATSRRKLQEAHLFFRHLGLAGGNWQRYWDQAVHSLQ